jgi:hypothetical protein
MALMTVLPTGSLDAARRAPYHFTAIPFCRMQLP